MFDLILRGGKLVNPRGQYQADIAVQDGKIVCIAQELDAAQAAQAINLDGEYVLPGCIDSHMHLWEPGLVAEPDFRAGTLAATAGGMTTIIDHPLTIPEVLDARVFAEKVELGERTSYTDFALHGGVGHDNLEELQGLWEAGCTAFKIFMCESGSKVAGLSTGEMLAAFRKIGSFGGTVLLHAENDEILRFNRQKLDEAGRSDPLAFVEWRPPEAEIEAIQRALYLLEGTGTRAVLAHTTVPEGVAMARERREKGLDVWVETCPHNLYLTVDDLRQRGPWVTYSPPVRDRERVEKLWEQLRKGWISLMGSDHGPVDIELKKKGEVNIFEGQFGIPGTETMLPLMLDAVAKGRVSLERVVDLLAEQPARFYGLYPRKGAIQVGCDADFTIVDMRQRYALRAKEMYTSCGWIPYEGWEVTGRVTRTILRGKVVMQHGKLIGRPGDGKFVVRQP